MLTAREINRLILTRKAVVGTYVDNGVCRTGRLTAARMIPGGVEGKLHSSGRWVRLTDAAPVARLYRSDALGLVTIPEREDEAVE